MVRPRKTRSRKHKTILRVHAAHLLNDDGFCVDYKCRNDGVKDGGEKRAARDWQLVKDDFTEAWIQCLPGTRPWGWWRHESPGPRQCLNHDISDLPQWTKYYFGCSTVFTRQQMESHGMEKPMYETEYDYLQRHSLLTAAEKKLPADVLRGNSSTSWRGQESEKIEPILELLNYVL